MRKRLMVGIVMISLLFSGCGKKQDVSSLDISSLDASKPNNFADCLVDMIQKKDGERLYNFFSDETKEYDKNLLEESQAFVDSFEGDFVSYQKMFCETSEKSRVDEDDKYSEQIHANYTITTTEETYFVSFYYTNETPKREYLGLQTLGVQIESEFDNDPCICSGIHGCYVVTPDNHEELIERRDYDLEHADW
ncbi:MAG: DUF5104 domain-containing protein [Lachnospiraceae bacterium]|nr:DUF5104 domain-containing protein [Lachnospiraceae bacterium]